MGNDMFNDEQLKHAEILQKETEEALGFWKERTLKAEAKLADKYLIEEQYEAACGDRDGLLRMVETLREQKDRLEAEWDAALLAATARETERPVMSIHGMHDTCDLCQRAIPDGCYAVFCGTCEDKLRAAFDGPPPVPIDPPAPAPDAVREAAERLLAKIDEVNAHPAYLGIWDFAAQHDIRYTGPRFVDELDALRAALDAAQKGGKG